MKIWNSQFFTDEEKCAPLDYHDEIFYVTVGNQTQDLLRESCVQDKCVNHCAMGDGNEGAMWSQCYCLEKILSMLIILHQKSPPILLEYPLPPNPTTWSLFSLRLMLLTQGSLGSRGEGGGRRGNLLFLTLMNNSRFHFLYTHTHIPPPCTLHRERERKFRLLHNKINHF